MYNTFLNEVCSLRQSSMTFFGLGNQIHLIIHSTIELTLQVTTSTGYLHNKY